jgi:hypothetical protein
VTHALIVEEASSMDEQHSSPCDLANLYISSTNDFVGEMIMSQYMLGLFV